MTGDGTNDSPARAGARGPAIEIVVQHVERTCRRIIDGRQAARALAAWTQPFHLSESEFQLLWILRPRADEGLDQTTLARVMAFSPAQVSATVERARAKGWIAQHNAPGDRRRHFWRLTNGGLALVEQIISALNRLQPEPFAERDASSREAAA
jgi:DNA-binding MarR family transcriptional regulator